MTTDVPFNLKYLKIVTINFIVAIFIFTILYKRRIQMNDAILNEITKYKIYMCTKCKEFKDKECKQKRNVVECARRGLKINDKKKKEKKVL